MAAAAFVPAMGDAFYARPGEIDVTSLADGGSAERRLVGGELLPDVFTCLGRDDLFVVGHRIAEGPHGRRHLFARATHSFDRPGPEVVSACTPGMTGNVPTT